ncbi:MAG: hypothetical protein HY658_06335 [Actinobacteria bacterium]|nr:hypothetical protein [Actinomycetota bacterium]
MSGRSALGALLSLVLVLGAASPAAAGFDTVPDAVRWDVDYEAKTITVTVRLAFYMPTGAPFVDLVNQVTGEILRQWSGHRFKCFDFKVQIEARAVQSIDQVGEDEVDVRLDASKTYVRSAVWTTGSQEHTSDSPDDRRVPGRWDPEDANGRITNWWVYDQGAWAHEFGHVLGLQDNYVEETGGLKPGALYDTMYDAVFPVSPEMITRLVRRSGEVDESKVKCPMTVTAGPVDVITPLASIEGLYFHTYTCDYEPPTSDPARMPKPITFVGEGGYSGSYLGVRGTTGHDVKWTFRERLAPTQIVINRGAKLTAEFDWTPRFLLITRKGMLINGVDARTIFGVPLYAVTFDGAQECRG